MSAVHALVLAAGAGSRFGGRKLLSPFGDGVLLHGALAAATAAPVESVTVVTGADTEEVEQAVAAFSPGIRCVYAARHAEGLSASLQAGLAALPADALGALVFLGDMPHIPHEALGPLVEAIRTGAPAAVPTFDGRRGHPVALARSLFPELMRLTGDRGAGALLDGLGREVVRVPTLDAGVLFDVDVAADLKSAPGAP